MHSSIRGREIELVVNDKKSEWVFSDNKELIQTDPDFPCVRCGEKPTKEGHDACLGYSYPEAKNACCGHGVFEDSYIQLERRPSLERYLVFAKQFYRTEVSEVDGGLIHSIYYKKGEGFVEGPTFSDLNTALIFMRDVLADVEEKWVDSRTLFTKLPYKLSNKEEEKQV